MPRKAKVDRPRRQLNIHASPETRERLRLSGEAANRSIAKEVEFRLENSFARDQMIDLLLGGTDNGRLLERIAFIIRDAGEWRSDPLSVRKVIELIAGAIEEEGQPNITG